MKTVALVDEEVLTGGYKLGIVYQYMGNLKKHWRTLAGKEKALGVDHPDTLATVNNMAMVFSNQRQDDKALEWYGRALAGREKALGVNHPYTHATVNSMAKPLELYEQELAGMDKESILPFHSYKSMQCIFSMLVDVYERMGQREQAQNIRLRMTMMTQRLKVTSIQIPTKRAKFSLMPRL